MSEEMFTLGRRIRTEVLGEERVRKSLDEADAFSRDFQRMVTEYCWGTCWGRDGLDRRQRSLLNLGMLAALNRGPEFELHFRAAINNGLTLKELQDVVIQIAIYCGVPAGMESLRIANRVIKELRAAGELPAP